MLQKLNSTRMLLTLALVVIGVNLIFFLIGLEMKRHHGSSEILDLKFGYSPQEAMEILSQQGDYGRRLASWGLALDMIYPIAYGLLLVLLLYRFMPRIPTLLEYVVYALPVIAAISDWLENIWEWRMMVGFPEKVPLLAPTASAFTTAKWYALFSTVILLAMEIVVFLYYPTLRKHEPGR